MIKLQSSPKVYIGWTERSCTPKETLERIEKFVPEAGITRVADITDLDRIGIPVYSCIRPTAADGAISVYNGKGGTPEEARVAGIMEGIERYSAEAIPRDIANIPYSCIRRTETALDPIDLILPNSTNADLDVPWVEGWDITNDESIKVPLCAVIHPNPFSYPTLFRTSSNGIASGNTLEEAIFYALTEVIERDAWSLVETTRNTGPKLIDLPPRAAEMLAKFTAVGIEVTLRDITSDVGIPTIAAVSDDIELKDPRLLTIGMGTHTNPEIAMIRALSEVAQSRATQIHGAREDATLAEFREMMGYDRVKRMNAYWFKGDEYRSANEIPNIATDDFKTDIELIVKNLAAVGLDRVIVFDLTDPVLQIPVVRVVVPGLECYTIDNERRGQRCVDIERRRLHRS
ncbi:MAG TPA: YcaO-related McrA-glycine thioamidation protein [Methanocorpusculum sp.]|nr:YcaO-related McrA-glycine thioamidation protein [Methanocorpusculum sp.]HJJ51125.1 YcaO-related McrA-glycine thioamidation protein [Methanocorpusculum sp.]